MSLAAEILGAWREAQTLQGETVSVVQKRTVTYNVETGANGATTTHTTSVSGLVIVPSTRANEQAQHHDSEVAVEAAELLLQVARADLPVDLVPGDTATINSVVYKVLSVSPFPGVIYEATLKGVR